MAELKVPASCRAATSRSRSIPRFGDAVPVSAADAGPPRWPRWSPTPCSCGPLTRAPAASPVLGSGVRRWPRTGRAYAWRPGRAASRRTREAARHRRRRLRRQRVRRAPGGRGPRGGRARRPVDRAPRRGARRRRVRRGRPRRGRGRGARRRLRRRAALRGASLVGESVQQPELYWQGNVVATVGCSRRCAATARRGWCSPRPRRPTASRSRSPIREDAPTRPTNPYGASKLAIDHMIASYARGARAGRGEPALLQRGRRARPLRRAARRGDPPDPARAAGRRPGSARRSQIFGDDWPTPDGTCVRDYIHVDDLADAHLLALAHARAGRARRLQPGQRHGFSVREVVEACRDGDRAPDPGRDRAAPGRRPGRARGVQRARRRAELGWTRAAPTSPTIVADAWRFTQLRHGV